MRLELEVSFKSKRARVAAILVAILFVASLAAIVSALTPNIPTYGQPGSMVTTADYIDFTDGSGNYFARNGFTGLIDFSGSNATTVLQSSINALRGHLGTVHFKGVWNLSSGIILYAGMYLEGDGQDSAFAPAANSTLVIATGYNGPVITVQIDPSYTAVNTMGGIRELAILGGSSVSATNQHGIYIPMSGTTGILDFYITDVNVFSVGGDGVHIDTNTGIYQTKVWIERVYSEDNYNGVYSGSNTVVRCVSCYLTGNKQNGLYALSNAFIDSSIFKGNSQSGIKPYSSTSLMLISNSQIIGNVVWGVDARSSQWVEISGSDIQQNGNAAGTDAGGGVAFWGAIKGLVMTGNRFFYNGNANNADTFLNSLSVSVLVQISGNLYVDTRGSSASKYFIYDKTAAFAGAISDNTFSGQKTGNPAILVSNNTASVIIADNHGYNDVLGLITNPFYSTYTTIAKIGLAGTSAAPVASVTYTVYCVNQHIISTAGTGVSITVKDPLGNTVYSGLATFDGTLNVGWTINWGAFSVAPTVVSYVL